MLCFGLHQLLGGIINPKESHDNQLFPKVVDLLFAGESAQPLCQVVKTFCAPLNLSRFYDKPSKKEHL